MILLLYGGSTISLLNCVQDLKITGRKGENLYECVDHTSYPNGRVVALYLFSVVSRNLVDGTQLTYPVRSQCIVGKLMNRNLKQDPPFCGGPWVIPETLVFLSC